jgi:heme-degrading monooxygenase HmoA
MSVLEITQLRLRTVAADDPALIQNLSAVREKLHTSSQFYNCIDDAELIYILGIWPNLEAHVNFLNSSARDEVLGPQEDMLQFCWTIHVELGGINLLPLEAPILAMERFRLKEYYVKGFERAVTRYAQQLRGNNPFRVAHGWRCDAQGTHEALVFTGWETAQTHVTLTANADNDHDVAVLQERSETVQIIRGRNLERKEG